MKKIRYGLIVLCMLFCLATSAAARVSISINLPVFPQLIMIPGYPVYYAPQVAANYFFYDGMYWVYQEDIWYASTWYNGPWSSVEPEVVPLFILRIPVYYYRQPPVYFRGWQSNAPPRWGQHWGHKWEERRNGWNRWGRNSVPARAPRVEQQQPLRTRNYNYHPRDTIIRQHHNQQDRLQRKN